MKRKKRKTQKFRNDSLEKVDSTFHACEQLAGLRNVPAQTGKQVYDEPLKIKINRVPDCLRRIDRQSNVKVAQ
jgi:hypothetical protein